MDFAATCGLGISCVPAGISFNSLLGKPTTALQGTFSGTFVSICVEPNGLPPGLDLNELRELLARPSAEDEWSEWSEW
jgi:hypothetical protein